LYLFHIKQEGTKYSLSIAHTIKIDSMFLNDMLESRIKRKVKIWTLGNSVYVTWNHNTITVWKFAQKTSIKSQSAKNKNGRNRRGKNDKKTLNDKNDAGKVKVDTKVVKN
jgi:hypothetical protein